MVESLPDNFSARRAKTPGLWAAALALLLALCWPARGSVPQAGGQSVALTWDGSTSAAVAGYAVYYGEDGTNFEHRVDVGVNTSCVVAGLIGGQTNYFAVAAYNAQGVESPTSNIILYVVPGVLSVGSKAGPRSATVISFPVAPGHTYKVQASVNLQTWSTLWQISATNNAWTEYHDAEGANLRMRFYRLAWQ
jgi:hypothetical protein